MTDRPRFDSRHRPRRIQRKIDARLGYRRCADGKVAAAEAFERLVSMMETLSDKLPEAIGSMIDQMTTVAEAAFSKVLAERLAFEVSCATDLTPAEAIDAARDVSDSTGMSITDALAMLRDHGVRGGQS